MNSQFKIKGIISAERPCECCGNTQLEKNVVLERIDDGSLLYVGTTCAGYMLLGKKSRKNSEVVERVAKAHEYAKKWTGIHGTAIEVLQKIAAQIRVHFCPAAVVNGKILIGSELN